MLFNLKRSGSPFESDDHFIPPSLTTRHERLVARKLDELKSDLFDNGWEDGLKNDKLVIKTDLEDFRNRYGYTFSWERCQHASINSWQWEIYTTYRRQARNTAEALKGLDDLRKIAEASVNEQEALESLRTNPVEIAVDKAKIKIDNAKEQLRLARCRMDTLEHDLVYAESRLASAESKVAKQRRDAAESRKEAEQADAEFERAQKALEEARADVKFEEMKKALE